MECLCLCVKQHLIAKSLNLEEPHIFLRFPSASHAIWEEVLELPTEGEKIDKFEKSSELSVFLTGLPSKEMILLEACLLGFFWKLSELGEGKYPTQAH